MQEIGTVMSVEGGVARVRVKKTSACEGCREAAACSVDEGAMVIEAINPVDAAVGQSVRINSGASSSYLRAALVVYGIPALSLLIGAVVGRYIPVLFETKFSPDILSAAGGVSFTRLSRRDPGGTGEPGVAVSRSHRRLHRGAQAGITHNEARLTTAQRRALIDLRSRS